MGVKQRTAEEKAAIPAVADASVALVAGVTASVAVAPFLMCVDRAVVSAAAGTAPGGSLARAIFAAASEFFKHPKVAFTSPALWMVAGVYGGTYFAKNVSDVVIERTGTSGPIAEWGKFGVVTGVNMGGSILKDAAFARLFGAAVAAGAAAAVVPTASYVLFAARDCLTIGGAFVVPDAAKDLLVASCGMSPQLAGAAAQLVSPPLMQVVCTPLHLLALNMVNAPVATLAQRVAALKVSTPPALIARSLRMLPAYGIGGILNTTLSARGRDAARRKFLPSAEDLKAVKERLGRRGGAAAAKLANAKGRKALASIGVAARRGIVGKTKGSELNPSDDTGDAPFTLRTGAGAGGGGGGARTLGRFDARRLKAGGGGGARRRLLGFGATTGGSRSAAAAS
ncbi:predicted protein [Micromonas commoda]|uniref:Mitochondrial carrier family n=1 Tax=Micromonas commoda (strain RCC299 / NOUM17 / CCMP2709) TaxID=296587 RepID=C1DZU8_MICCC|nr:predicted protein [Micromonas commoda]ACO60711.1 predicted protein [Micromonas commoda]|eukprot:XP_002499453.1 predicted protein [Micromonas commoda]